ncbi:MAG: peptidoglycan glycosyltransferase [Opitutaceae bacterium]|nr:peptidoglycan glycosyltransferase [Opitutaceae bacterium]
MPSPSPNDPDQRACPGETRLPDAAADPPDPATGPRLRRLWRAVQGLLVLLLAALAYWQLGRAGEYEARDRRQSLRRVMIPAPRGEIRDRDGRVLAGNRSRIDAVVDLGMLRGAFARELAAAPPGGSVAAAPARARLAVVQRELDRVGAVIDRPGRVDAARLERHFARARTQPFVLVEDLAPREAERLAAALAAADPVRVAATHRRFLPHGRTAEHVLGRVRTETIRTPARPGLVTLNYTGDVGESGLERALEPVLRGRPGEATIRVDAWGFPVGEPFERREPEPGAAVTLSLDLEVQVATERALDATAGGPRGAAVALAVETGEVLALASRPEPGGGFNRATQGLYAPGSVFKPFTLLAGLRGGTLQPQMERECGGSLEVGGRRFACHHAAGHGALALRHALARSCNVYAYRVGLAAGPEALASEARRFHLGEPTGIDLPFETRRMLVPDPAWKEAAGRGRWTAGDTVNLAIGQGFLRCSPLQLACAVASLARRETLTVPTLRRSPGRRPSGERPAEPLGLADADYAALIAGLQDVVRIGIGQSAQVPGVSIAGKTGTAQVEGAEGMTNVAWFVAFAPVDRPEVAVAVALEGGRPGEEFAGAEQAAPVVREMLAAYFGKRAPR